MPTWLVRVTGHEFDLRALTEQLRSPECTVSEEKNNEYYLRSRSFDTLEDVWLVAERGQELIQRLNGVSQLLNGKAQPVSYGSDVMRINDDGKRETWCFPPPLKARSAMFISLDGDAATKEPTIAEAFMMKAEEDPTVARAIRIFGQDHTWDNLYKVLDAIEGAVGGEAALKAKEWVPSRQIRLFTHTANSVGAVGDEARHGHERFTAPAEPQSLDEATELIRGLLSQLLRSREASGDDS